MSVLWRGCRLKLAEVRGVVLQTLIDESSSVAGVTASAARAAIKRHGCGDLRPS
jgi:hypothetical protein